MPTDFQTTAYEFARSAIQSARREASSKLTKAFPDCMDDSIVPAIDQAFRLCQAAARIVTEMQQIHDYERPAAELKRRCPGYPEDTYRLAIQHAHSDYIR
jgi:hypothetical protein